MWYHGFHYRDWCRFNGQVVQSRLKDYIKSAHEDNCPDNHMTFYYMHTSINTGRGSEFTIKHSFTTLWVWKSCEYEMLQLCQLLANVYQLQPAVDGSRCVLGGGTFSQFLKNLLIFLKFLKKKKKKKKKKKFFYDKLMHCLNCLGKFLLLEVVVQEYARWQPSRMLL